MSTIEKAAARLAARTAKTANQEAPADAEPELDSSQADAASAAVPTEASQAAVDDTFPPEILDDSARDLLERSAAVDAKIEAADLEAEANSLTETADGPLSPDPMPEPISDRPAANAQARTVQNFHEIDLADLESRGFLTPNAGRTRLAQDLRRIKRPLLLNIHKARQSTPDESSPPNLIMLTSALPGEGKTFLSINLAISLAAELDHRVLLVDGDLAKGDIAQQLGIHAEVGLSNLLRQDHYQIEQGVLGTNIEGLSVLPAGRSTENIDELFASRQMAHITKTLANQDLNRTIVFDAPPLMATTEAHVLASVMGQVVLVIEANRTPQNVVYDALEQLKAVPT